jgi:predicted hydrocarbon binding protein
MMLRGELDETRPKEIMLYHFNPKRKVYFGSVVLKNVPGALAGVATALAKAGVNLTSSESANIEGTPASSWGFFAETSDSIDVKKIQTLIEGSGYAMKVDVSEGGEGVVVDSNHYPLRFSSGQQAMTFRRENVVDMFNRIRRIFGSGANLIIYEMGVAAGESDGVALVESVGPGVVSSRLLDLIYLYAAEGWGMPEVVDVSIEPLRATIRFKDSFECAYTKSAFSNGHYLRGHLVGLCESLFHKRVKVEETKCISKGDGYCEFVGEEQA